MKGFIVAANHYETDEHTRVQCFGRLENKQSFVTTNTLTPYFFIKKSDVKKAGPLLSKYRIHETKLLTFHGEPVTKIEHDLQSQLTKLKDALHAKSIDTYEADIKPHYRWLIDNNIQGSLSLEGEYETADFVDRIYREPSIKPSDFVPQLNVLAIDIESDKTTGNLLCIGMYNQKNKHVFIITDKKLTNGIACNDEADCLEKVKQKIREIDPDIITGWNITDFDFPYLKERYEKNKIPFAIGRDTTQTKIRISESFFKDSVVTVAGRQVLDGLNLIKDPFIQEAPSIRNIDFEGWTLESAAQAIVGEGKLLKGKNRHEEITRLYKKDPQKLVDYNLQDAKLAFDILEKTKTIELAIERSQLTGVLMEKRTASVIAFDSLYIREARKRGFVSPTTRYTAKEERITGGYVMDSKAGIYHEVLVLDFKSLYPSIIKTFNIDPASFLEKKEKNAIEAPNHVYFKNEDGILPAIIDRLHQAREKAKQEKRELASYAIKIIMNSFFGVLASPNCRYFSLDIANAITHFAQFIIKLTAEKIRERGLDVIYSDTDSVFVESKREKHEVVALGKELQAHINEFYKELVKKQYNRHSYLELELKRHYLSFLIPSTRHTEKGSKKRYAGLLEKDGKEELEIVGLEAIRGDWTDAAKEFQEELLMRIFHREEFIDFIKKYVKKIQEGKMDSKLVYRKSIRKNLEEYTKTTPPHVKAARKLEKLESNIIEYYITTDGPEPIQKLTHPLDYNHYIDKQIAPIANTILSLFGKKFEDIMTESKQTKLFN